MVCTSGSVESVAKKTQKANDQVKKLQEMLQQDMESTKKKFYAEIDRHLHDAGVHDARELTYSADIKTEYTSEFSLDKLAGVITKALDAVKAAKDPKSTQPATSPEAIDAYKNLVNSVAEAAKSSSTSASSLSFSMNRLSPGVFAFLQASSVNMKDEDTFGSEAITSTAIFYRIIESIDDVKNEAEFVATLIDQQSYLHMKILQAALVDDLASGKLSLDEWQKKDDAYSGAVAKLKKSLEGHASPTNAPKLFSGSSSSSAAAAAAAPGHGGPHAKHSANHDIVCAALAKYKAGHGNHQVIVKIEGRLNSGFY